MPSKKRGRDDDGDGDVAIGGTEGFTEHRNVCALNWPRHHEADAHSATS